MKLSLMFPMLRTNEQFNNSGLNQGMKDLRRSVNDLGSFMNDSGSRMNGSFQE